MKQVSYKSARVVQKILVLFLLLLPCGIRGQTPSATPTEDTLEKLASDFWSWRAKYAPFTGDDVNRLERPGGVRDWSAATIDKRGRGLKDFDARYQKIDADGWPVPQQVDYRLIVAGALGIGGESALETRSEFLHRANSHPDCGSADGARTI